MMKHVLLSILLLLAVLLPTIASAHDFEVDGIYYNINGNEATVTYKGTDYGEFNDEYSGNVTIPSTVTYDGATYSVTAIEDFAFTNSLDLISIKIPSSIINIGFGAFAFCSGLTTVDIPNSVTSIGEDAFLACYGLTDVTIGNSVTSIGHDTFENCTSLINVTIGNSVTTIEYGAFWNCSSLKKIDIPNSVISISGPAFGNCSSLTRVTIGNSLSYIESYAFDSCTALTSIIVASDNPNYDSRNNCNAIIETASNTLIFGCKNTIIPNSVTTIGNMAFWKCTGLISITIPNSVTEIGERAFEGCNGLTNVNIPNSVTAIGGSAFEVCNGLTNVNIPNSVTTIGNYAFYGCSGLTNINIPNSVTTIGYNAFYNCTSLNEVHSYITDLSSISMGDQVFYCSPANYGDRTLYVPYGTSADYQADTKWSQFFGSIVEMPYSFKVDGIYYIVTLDNKVEVTKNPTINYAGNITIPNSVTYGGTTYTVTTIGDQAFANCTGLTSITIPGSVTSVGKQAFMNAAAIETVKCEATTPPSWDGLDMFTTNVYNHTPLIVPSGCARAYMSDQCWGQFIKIIGPGDVNMDGTISISDVTRLIDLLLTNGDAPTADVNGDGSFTIIDVAYVIDLLLSSK